MRPLWFYNPPIILLLKSHSSGLKGLFILGSWFRRHKFILSNFLAQIYLLRTVSRRFDINQNTLRPHSLTQFLLKDRKTPFFFPAESANYINYFTKYFLFKLNDFRELNRRVKRERKRHHSKYVDSTLWRADFRLKWTLSYDFKY